MSENQLREAYTLMKQGDKKGAAKLIQDVLREDRSNANAWWLFSHVLEDEDKVVKSLEKVLALNPEHPGARKRLSQMRPEYTNLAPVAPPVFKTKPRPAKKSGSVLPWLFGIVAFFVSGLIGFGLVTSLLNGGAGFSLEEIEGPPPEEVAILQLSAAFRGDYETMRLYTCDSLEEEWTDIIDSMNAEIDGTGFSLNDIHFDFSELRLVETSNTGRQVVYDVAGEISMKFQGMEISVDVKEATGIEEASMILTVNDNRWVVCSL